MATLGSRRWTPESSWCWLLQAVQALQALVLAAEAGAPRASCRHPGRALACQACHCCSGAQQSMAASVQQTHCTPCIHASQIDLASVVDSAAGRPTGSTQLVPSGCLLPTLWPFARKVAHVKTFPLVSATPTLSCGSAAAGVCCNLSGQRCFSGTGAELGCRPRC